MSVNAATPPAPRTLWRDDLVATLTGGLLILGLFLDGWNHLNLQNGKAGEFLTPWHGLLYAGFNACAIWAITRNTRLRAMMFKRPGKSASGVTSVHSAPQFNARHVALLGLGLAGAGVIGDAIARAAGVVPETGAMQPPFDFLLFTGAGLLFAIGLRAAAVQIDGFGKRVALPALVGTAAAAAVVFAFGSQAATKSVDNVVKTIAAQPSVVQSAPRTAPAGRHARHVAVRAHHRAAVSSHAHRASSSSSHHASQAVLASAAATATHTHRTSSSSSSQHATRTVVVHRRAATAPQRRSAARPAPHRTSAKSKGRFQQVAIPDVPSDSPSSSASAPASSSSSGSSSSAPAATSPAASPTAAPTPTASTPTASNPPATPPTAAKHGGQGPG